MCGDQSFLYLHMRITLFCLLNLLYLGLSAQLFPELGAQRAGISALTFLKIEVSPRSAALGSANICLTGDAYSTYTSPATAAEVETFSVAASNTFWVADMNYSFLSAIMPSRIGNFGVSLSALNSGPMDVRTTFQPLGTGEKFYANYYTAAFTYSQQLTEQFSYGLTAKYVHEQLAEFSAGTAMFDLAFLYQTDIKELRFAVMVQNFGLNSSLSGEIDNPSGFNDLGFTLDDYPAPTLFKLGVSFVPYRSEEKNQSLTAMLQLNHPNDNAENLRMGLEYNYRDLLFLRAGYKINVQDQPNPTAGLGVRMRIGKHPLMMDYGFDPMQFVGVIHRVGLSFSVNKS